MNFINIDVKLFPDRTGRVVLLPGLSADDSVVMQLVWYAEAKRKKCSLSTLLKIREAFRLFLEYSAANDPGSMFGAERPIGVKPWQHFVRFRDALLDGTFSVKTGLDPSNLGWRPSSVGKANDVVRYLTDFFVWADDDCGANDAQRFNPQVTPSRKDELMQRATYEYKRSQAFLGHTWAKSGDIRIEGRAVGRAKEPRKHTKEEPVRFPADSFERLLLEGFTTRSPSNLRDILITVLLNKGGLRESEPMHLYVSDVSYDPATDGALVVIPHPSTGKAPRGRSGELYTNRQDYLARRHNMLPRDMVTRTLHAGWKSEFEEIKVFWFEPKWGRAFWVLWQRYLAQIVHIRRGHPFAFISLAGPFKGEPLKLDAFNKSHETAVYKAGLVPIVGDVDLKALGLTPHGHRHAYAHRAKNEAKLGDVLVQRMMHHGSIESQKDYTNLSRKEVLRLLEEASKRMHGGATGGDGIAAMLVGVESALGAEMKETERLK